MMRSGRRIWGHNAKQPGRWQKPLSRFFWFFTESWGSKQELRQSTKKLHAEGA